MQARLAGVWKFRTAFVLDYTPLGPNLWSASHLITKASISTRTATPVAKTKLPPVQILFDRPAADQNVGKKKATGAPLGLQKTKRIVL
jgi:hypothetical protein